MRMTFDKSRLATVASSGSIRHQPTAAVGKGRQWSPLAYNRAHSTRVAWQGGRKPDYSCRAGNDGGDAEDSGDEDVPQVMGDWRAFRAKLVSESSDTQKTSREATDNFKLLSQQNPALASEGLWCHPATVEAGGIVVAQPCAPDTLGDERYWQVVMFLIQHDSRGTVGLILNRPSGITLGALPIPDNGPGGLQASFPQNALYLGGFNANQTSAKQHPWRWRGSRHIYHRNGGDGADDRPLPATESEALVSSRQRVLKDCRLHCGGYTNQQVVYLVHGRKELSEATQVVPGIYMGGEKAALEAVDDGKAEANEFRFFAGCKVWEPGQLAAEIEAGAWVSASCSRSLVLKQCLGLPTPLWKEVMELMGGEFGAVARIQYGEGI